MLRHFRFAILIVSTQFSYLILGNCILKENELCECIGVESEDDFECAKSATTLIISDSDLENWPTKLQISSAINLTLTNTSLLEVPTNYLPSKLQTLDLSRNGITKILERQFSSFTFLRTLDLSANSISEIDSSAFEGLCALKELTLKDNNLTDFKSFSLALQRTPLLEVINLDENKFTNIFLLEFLHNLEYVYLKNNKVSNIIAQKCTYNLPNLKQVDLRRNQLETFPRSLLSLTKTDFLLSNNLIQCHCDILFYTQMNECLKNKTVNLVESCRETPIETRSLASTESLVLSPNSMLHGRKIVKSNCGISSLEFMYVPEVNNEVCWDVPESLCEETLDLITVKNDGSLDLTLAAEFKISGNYTYREFHTCNETYLNMVTGQVYVSRNSQMVCASKKYYCANHDSNNSLELWHFALIAASVCLLVIVIIVVFIKCKKQRHTTTSFTNNVEDGETHLYDNRQHDIRYIVTSFAVRNGLLTIHKQEPVVMSTTNCPALTAGVDDEGYKMLSVDEDGYLMVTSDIIHDYSSINGYFTYIPEDSSIEISVDPNGYLSINTEIISTAEDGYACLILKKDQRLLGQLVLDDKQYIQLVNLKSTDDNHTYAKLQSTWQLLRFWEKKEEESRKIQIENGSTEPT